MKRILFFILIFLSAVFSVKLSGGTVLKGGENYSFFYNSGGAVEVYKPSQAEIDFGVSLKNKIGESCEVALSDLGRFLTELRAKFVCEEKGEDFFNLYYYSPLIGDVVTVGGKKVNLHVSLCFRGKNPEDIGYVTVASPINYGGY